MEPHDAAQELARAGAALSDDVDRLTTEVVGLAAGRADCAAVADHYEDFATRMAATYPSLAGPAARLGELFRDLDAALGRVGAGAEAVIAEGGRTADEALRLTAGHPPD